MQNVEVLGPFIGKVVVDITTHIEEDPIRWNESYIKLTFDDDSFICFPRSSEDFWFKIE